MSSILPVARIAGVEVRVHLSWVLLLALVTLALAVELPAIYPEWSPALAWATAGIVAILGMSSVATHELAHAFVARRRHSAMNAVTLYVVGGTVGFEGDASGPGEDAAIALAGPVASLALGVVCLAIWQASAFDREPIGSAVAMGAFLIGVLNVAIALVNLVPGFPLDGGRVVRAVVWRLTGSERRGMRAAVAIGRSLGLVAVLSGMLVALVLSSPEGLLTMLCGWLMTNAARVLDRRMMVEQLTEGLHVEDAIESEGVAVGEALTLDTFAERAVQETPGAAVRVVNDGRVVGLIGNTQLRRVGRRRWPGLRARDLMTRLETLPALAPEQDLWTGLEQLQRSRQEALPVIRDGELVGLATRRSVALAVHQQAERQGFGGGRGRGRGLPGFRRGIGGPNRVEPDHREHEE